MDSLRKGKLNLIKLMGMVFAGIGAVLALVGIVLLFALKGADMELYWLPTVILCSVGVIFVALGIFFVLRERGKAQMADELKARGEAIQAEVTGVNLNYSVSLNGRHPYVVEASYRDPFSGKVHVFRSRNLDFDPREYVQGKTVPVYCKGDDFSNYFMDIDAILPEVEIH